MAIAITSNGIYFLGYRNIVNVTGIVQRNKNFVTTVKN